MINVRIKTNSVLVQSRYELSVSTTSTKKVLTYEVLDQVKYG
jgi:hypothetical protein